MLMNFSSSAHPDKTNTEVVFEPCIAPFRCGAHSQSPRGSLIERRRHRPTVADRYDGHMAQFSDSREYLVSVVSGVHQLMVAIVTPMHEDGSLDFEAFRKLIDWHITQGTDGIAAEAMADAIARQLKALRTPLIPVGTTPTLATFPGSQTIRLLLGPRTMQLQTFCSPALVPT